MNPSPYAAAPSRIEAGRLRYIDALRGIAALLVVWLHVANSYHALSPTTAEHSHWLNDVISQIDIGRIGVVVFFLISGFVIPFSLRADGDSPVLPFAIKRFFRIYPAYWLSVPLGALTTYWIFGADFGVRDFLVNLTLLQDFFGIKPAESLYWTLSVELVFYVLCIVLFVTGSLFAMRRIGVLAAAMTLVFSAWMVLHWRYWPGSSSVVAFWFVNLATMLWGTLYRSWLHSKQRDPVASFLMWGLFAYLVIVLPAGASLAIGVQHNVTLAYALGFLVFLAGTTLVRIETALTDWLGRISYSIYLFHPIVFLPIYLWLSRQPAGSLWRTQNLAVYLGINVLLTLAVASLVFRFVERPAIRFGHRLAAKYEHDAMCEARAVSPQQTAQGRVASGNVAS